MTLPETGVGFLESIFQKYWINLGENDKHRTFHSLCLGGNIDTHYTGSDNSFGNKPSCDSWAQISRATCNRRTFRRFLGNDAFSFRAWGVNDYFGNPFHYF